MQRRPTILNWLAEEFDTPPSLVGTPPTAGHVFGCNGRSGRIARKPREDENGNNEPTKPAHGETFVAVQKSRTIRSSGWHARGAMERFALAQDATVRPMPCQVAFQESQVVALSADSQIVRFMTWPWACGETATRTRSRVAIWQQDAVKRHPPISRPAICFCGCLVVGFP